VRQAAPGQVWRLSLSQVRPVRAALRERQWLFRIRRSFASAGASKEGYRAAIMPAPTAAEKKAYGTLETAAQIT